MEVDGSAVGYSLDRLKALGLINARASDRALVVMAKSDGGRFDVYEREVDIRTLTFQKDHGKLMDVETGSTWNPADGSAIAGPLAGRRLRRVPGKLVEGSEFTARCHHAREWP